MPVFDFDWYAELHAPREHVRVLAQQRSGFVRRDGSAVGLPGREHGLHLPAGAPVLRCPVRPVHDARSDGVRGRGEPVRVYGQ